MRIQDVVRHKGGDVVTIAPDATVQQLLALLDAHRIGAVVVSADGAVVEGIVSERDVVRALHARGGGLLTAAVREVMTADVVTVGPDADVEQVMRLMTDRRFRHAPVVQDGRLCGIASIGDVVKSRIDGLQLERDHLVGYLHG